MHSLPSASGALKSSISSSSTVDSIANSYSAAYQFLDAYHHSLSHQQLHSHTDPISHPMNLMSLDLNDSNQVSVGNTQISSQ